MWASHKPDHRDPRAPRDHKVPVGAQGATGATGTKGTTSAPPRNRSKEEVVLAAPRDLANGLEDPYFTHLIVNAWNSLSKLDNNLVPQPELAESWESNDDATVWTIKLRSGITFQDGEVFDAGAVAANIERYVQISPRSSRYFSYTKERAMGEFEKVEAVDASTVRLTLGRPRPALPNTMSKLLLGDVLTGLLYGRGELQCAAGERRPVQDRRVEEGRAPDAGGL